MKAKKYSMTAHCMQYFLMADCPAVKRLCAGNKHLACIFCEYKKQAKVNRIRPIIIMDKIPLPTKTDIASLTAIDKDALASLPSTEQAIKAFAQLKRNYKRYYALSNQDFIQSFCFAWLTSQHFTGMFRYNKVRNYMRSEYSILTETKDVEHVKQRYINATSAWLELTRQACLHNIICALPKSYYHRYNLVIIDNGQELTTEQALDKIAAFKCKRQQAEYKRTLKVTITETSTYSNPQDVVADVLNV